MTKLYAQFFNLFSKIPQDFILLMARIFPAAVFWASGETKRTGFGLHENAVDLFKTEYNLPFIDPTLAAWAAMIAEHVFPALLLVGFLTRFSALSLLMMTLVIQIFVYPGAWSLHGLWALCFILLLKEGAGRFSLDYYCGIEPRNKA
jgi:putative oxidoreductase